MNTGTNGRENLNAVQTRTLLSSSNRLSENLEVMQNVELDEQESCRALLNSYIYSWSVAEASGLRVAAEIAEIGITEMCVRLGMVIDTSTRPSKWKKVASKYTRPEIPSSTKFSA
jgi:hypothetical protein